MAHNASIPGELSPVHPLFLVSLGMTGLDDSVSFVIKIKVWLGDWGCLRGISPEDYAFNVSSVQLRCCWLSRLMPTSSNEMVEEQSRMQANSRHPDTPLLQLFCVSQHAWLSAYESGTEEWEVEEFYWRFHDWRRGVWEMLCSCLFFPVGESYE